MYAQISNGVTDQALMGITIPPCPAVLTSIMREAKRPSADFASISNLISRDAGIVGPLLKLANSPFVGLKSKATSVFQAVSVLGMQNTVNLVQNIALRQSIGGASQSFEKFWGRSSMSATVAEKVAAKFPSIAKDDAYIAALFHDCGIPVLMMKYPDYRETLMEQCKQGRPICDVENDSFSTSHTVVGNMLTRSWMLPTHVCKAILYHHDSTVFNSSEEHHENDICNLIGVVHMAERIVDEHLNMTSKEWHQFEEEVFKHFEMSAQEFFELKQDVLAFLNDE